MTLKIGSVAPDFSGETTDGKINFHDWIGNSWALLFSHPKDFTPVCTTELGCVANAKGDFAKRNVKVIGLSIDNVSDHKKWSEDIKQSYGSGVDFPIIADTDHKVAELYGMMDLDLNDEMTSRSIFIIGSDKKIKAMMFYPASVGRSFEEVFRVIDSLQLAEKYDIATPANWKDGDDVIIVPNVSDDEAKKTYPDGWKTVTPYLRTVAQPK